MSKIDKLLKNEKVEWKKLGEVCNIKRGRVISKIYLEEHKGEFPVYSSQTRNNGEIGRISTYDFDGEFATWTTDGAYAGTVFYRNGKFSVTNICGLIEPKDNKKLSVKFIVYWLQIEAKKHVKGGSGNPKLMSNVVERIKIPIPSIETQEKIVKTLDKFTNYVTELQSELQSRTKQYEYYRDMLLSEEYLNKISTEIMGSDNKSLNFKIEKLGDCLLNVKKIKWKEINSKIFKYIDLSSVSREFHYICDTDLIKAENAPSRAQQIVCKYDVLFGTTRPLLQRYCLVSEEYDNQICSTGFCVLRANRDKVLPKWLLYQISTSLFLEHLKTHEKGTSYPAISDSDLKLYKILVPSIEVQEHIVSILDKFDFIVNDISKGLPKEIELRQKQYEYYREKLLTFEK